MKCKKVKTEFDEEHFALCSKYKPTEYDLVSLVRDDGKELFGWWNGTEWVGARIKPEDKFIKWKHVHTQVS